MTTTPPRRPVVLTRVLSSDVNDAATSYRYQTAFIYERYAAQLESLRLEEAKYRRLERVYEDRLGFGFVIQAFPEHKRGAVATLTPGDLSALLMLARHFRANDMEAAASLPEWRAVAEALAASAASNGFILSPSDKGYFVKIEETSAKEFECYGSETVEVSPGYWRPRLYARALDLPWRQRRQFKAEVANNQAIPGLDPAHPPLAYFRGVGPYHSWHHVIAAIIAHEKCNVFVAKHAERDAPLHVYLVEWDPAMDTEREYRVYVRGGRVAAIGPWNPFGRLGTDGRRTAFDHVENVSDDALRALGERITDWAERVVAPRVASAAPEVGGDFTVDVLVTADGDDLRIVETGPCGPFMAAGSTLFSWLESDVFAEHPTGPVHMRVLTDDVARGVALSVTKPLPRPDLLP